MNNPQILKYIDLNKRKYLAIGPQYRITTGPKKFV